MSAHALCPNARICNFHRAAAQSGNAAMSGLVQAYCCDPARNGSCFRSSMLGKQGANLASDIAPNATIITGMDPVLPPSNLAADQAARIYARR